MITSDVLIIGGGAIGLTTAYELIRRGHSVAVIDRQAVGCESSWAGAGMIPPGEIHIENSSYRKIAQLSSGLWAELAESLRAYSNIDIEYRTCGALVLPEDQKIATTQSEVELWQQQKIPVERLNHKDLNSFHPKFNSPAVEAYFLPTQAQVRNPRYVNALKVTCEQLGVQFYQHEQIREIKIQHGQVADILTDTETFNASQIVIATGAWTSQFADWFEVSIPVEPIRGQIVLVKLSEVFPSIIERGKCYLVPRADGRVLIGATEELVGFDRDCEAETVKRLLAFGAELIPEIGDLQVEKSWCGFRPVTPDHLPVIGFVPGYENLLVNSGHYRAGLSLSPASGLVMTQLICGEATELNLEDFDPERFHLEISSNEML
ncbi:glycine oxidase ThiO [uncultured Rubinisphaera sp.]|uniref:glycine oxidase ThiO n=1 Tax=uncultured Rubinisphaera sp. TaxID=1678686 RepID=UPI0030DC32E4